MSLVCTKQQLSHSRPMLTTCPGARLGKECSREESKGGVVWNVPGSHLSFCPYLIQATMRYQAQLVYFPSLCGETDAIYSVWNRKERESVSGPDVNTLVAVKAGL